MVDLWFREALTKRQRTAKGKVSKGTLDVNPLRAWNHRGRSALELRERSVVELSDRRKPFGKATANFFQFVPRTWHRGRHS